MTGHHHVTGRAGKRNLSGYRRWGFESVRKGCCTSDARLQSFEKELFCCKLTVGVRGWNLWLHVSLGIVEKCCLSGFVKSFSLSVGLAWAENTNFCRKQKHFFSKWPCMIRKKPFSSIKNAAILENFSNCTWKSLFFQAKSLFFAQTLACCSKMPTCTNKKLSIRTSPSRLSQKATLIWN